MDDRQLEVTALCDGALTLSRLGNRIASLALLWAAVGIAPTDFPAHRRLAAALANSGDIDAAAEEYARFIEFMLKAGDFPRAALEFAYGHRAVGDHQAFLKVGRQMVPLSAAVSAMALPAPSETPALSAPASSPRPAAGTVEAIDPRRLPKFQLPSRFARIATAGLGTLLAVITVNNLIALAAHSLR